jgi:hypothetical protein
MPKFAFKQHAESNSHSFIQPLRTPGFLRHAPVDFIEKISHLSGADRDNAVGGRGRPRSNLFMNRQEP